MLLQAPVRELVDSIPSRIWLALFVLVLGVLLSYLVEILNRRLLERAGVPEAIEGTAFERTARDLGTSTVSIIAKLGQYFIIGLAIIVALTIVELEYVSLFIDATAVFLPQLFVAIVVLIAGIVVADKTEVFVAERLRGVKLPEIGVIPQLAKYSVLFVAALIALSQVGVATSALVVVLGAYALAIIVLLALATKDLLASCATGVYLLLNEPYGIGDEVRVAGQRGIVQEVDLFVTRIETEDEEHIIPNRNVFRQGIVRIRR
ncbi:mechanosensitive ion channel family protein [Haloferacaceae archaeon DSL9]